MIRKVTATVTMIALFSMATAALADSKKDGKIDGKKEFEEYCAVCHPNGGNIMNPAKSLGRKALAASGVKGAKDIIAKMRKPGPGMTPFDKKAISDKKAKAIAEYMLKTFK